MGGDDGHAGLKVGLREIYEQLLRLDTKVSLLMARHDDSRAEIADHENRIRVLERARWPLPSLAALVSIGAFVVALINALN